MKIKEMSLEDLELLSYIDIAYKLIKETKKTYSTPKLFNEICKLLNIGEEEMKEKIGDFYTSLTIDKRFILLDNLNWDLKENHKVKIVLEDDIEDQLEEAEDSEEDIKLEDDAVTGDVVDELNELDEVIDDDIDELEELSIISEDELEE